MQHDNPLDSESPLFSVLIANYNNGQYLEECLQSIFAQTYKNLEIILVDDASTDISRDIYAKYGNNKSVRIFFNRKNKGCGYTKRKCVAQARGEICGFVDPDDALAIEALHITVEQHLSHPDHSIIYSTHYICNEALKPGRMADYVGQIPSGRKSFTMLQPVISHFATFKRAKYLSTRGISGIYPKAVDKDLYFKLEDTGPVLFIEQPLYYYRHHQNCISLNEQALIAYDYELTIKLLALRRKDKDLVNGFPHSRTELIRALLNVVVLKFKARHIFEGIYLLLNSFLFDPAATSKAIFSLKRAEAPIER